MTDTFFGDFDVEDAFDTVPADPEQVARKLHGYRIILERMAGRSLDQFDDLSNSERDDLKAAGENIVDWVADNDPDTEAFAKAIHDAGGGDDWDAIPVDHRRLAFAIAALIAGWLIRQGAWR